MRFQTFSTFALRRAGSVLVQDRVCTTLVVDKEWYSSYHQQETMLFPILAQ